MDLENSTKIMMLGMRDGLFSQGNTLAAYLSSDRRNYVAARKIINGSDRAAVIAYYAERFEAILLRIKR